MSRSAYVRVAGRTVPPGRRFVLVLRPPLKHRELAAALSPKTVPTAPSDIQPSTSSQGPLIVQELRGSDVITIINHASPSNSASQPGPMPRNTSTKNYTAPVQEKAITFVKSMFLPDGYPASTTPDYLPYQLWATPTHILGSVAHALTTSSLLQAVGVSSGPVATTAASAAIKWITKDGLGALGRFFVGGSLSQEFDRDPRRWRMVAELVASLGAGLEIATAAFPQQFLLLASLGHFAKALAKAMGKPVFRVIQTHFALDNNVGAVAAKEEVWEVTAQLTGYAVSLVVLTWVDTFIVEQGGAAASSGTELVAIWVGVQTAHVFLRYRSLRALVFRSINEKRGIMLMSEYVAGRSLRSVTDINRSESFLPAHMCIEPRIHIGTIGLADLARMVTSTPASANTSAPDSESAVERLLQLYEREDYVLVWSSGQAFVVFKEGAGSMAILHAIWQACWLHMNSCKSLRDSNDTSDHSLPSSLSSSSASAATVTSNTRTPTTCSTSTRRSNSDEVSGEDFEPNCESNGNEHGVTSSGNSYGHGATGVLTAAPACEDSYFALLSESVRALMSVDWTALETEAEAQGWDLSSVLVGFGPVRFRTL